MKRRSFIQIVGGAAGGVALTSSQAAAAAAAVGKPAPTVKKVAGMPYRTLGRTGQEVSVIGFPGLALMHHDQETCNRGLRKAFDAGINYFDVAPAYGSNGDCEIKMGPGLQGLRRDRIFLACKTKKRDKEGAREELERSLTRLKTDHFDLYQMHHLRTVEEAKQALAPGGALETFLKAREEGKVKYFGFSAHTSRSALELMKGFRFDTVMFPLNFVEYFTLGFGKDVLDLANQQGAALLSIKAMSRGGWPQGVERTRKWWYRSVEDPHEVNLAVRFSLSLPGVVTAFTPAFLDLLDRAIEVGRNYRDLSLAEMNDLVKVAWECPSIFDREEKMVTLHESDYPDHPYGHDALA